uniref:Uncharacterized protein n=1 Tax=Chrysotila carterae TaxID=13221 RepID=A0A7S4C2Q3_CHRCT
MSTTQLPWVETVVRLAKEDDNGQYYVEDDAAVLRLDSKTLSIMSGEVQARAYVHFPLRSIKLGITTTKIMLVPRNRGPCWVCEFSLPSGANDCLRAIRGSSVSVDVQVVGNDLAATEAVQREEYTEKDLEQAAESAHFRDMVRMMVKMLRDRERLGLAPLVHAE